MSRNPGVLPGEEGSGAGSTPRPVRIHYRRPPDRESVFAQTLVLDRPGVKVTLAREVELDGPVRAGDRTILEIGADAVWFTIPGAWHDIGRFHLADGAHTGVYANILTPVDHRSRDRWYTTDLFLDLWLPRGGAPTILDEDQLDDAEERGWVEPETARRARAEARRLLEAAEAGEWPPEVVERWTLERALSAAAGEE